MKKEMQRKKTKNEALDVLENKEVAHVMRGTISLTEIMTSIATMTSFCHRLERNLTGEREGIDEVVREEEVGGQLHRQSFRRRGMRMSPKTLLHMVGEAE
jgi:hypothetical protein